MQFRNTQGLWRTKKIVPTPGASMHPIRHIHSYIFRTIFIYLHIYTTLKKIAYVFFPPFFSLMLMLIVWSNRLVNNYDISQYDILRYILFFRICNSHNFKLLIFFYRSIRIILKPTISPTIFSLLSKSSSELQKIYIMYSKKVRKDKFILLFYLMIYFFVKIK